MLDSNRVLAPAPCVLGPKCISNPDAAPFLFYIMCVRLAGLNLAWVLGQSNTWSDTWPGWVLGGRNALQWAVASRTQGPGRGGGVGQSELLVPTANALATSRYVHGPRKGCPRALSEVKHSAQPVYPRVRVAFPQSTANARTHPAEG